MTTKEFLRQALNDKRMIRSIEEQIEALETAMQNVKAIRYDKVNVQSSADNPLEANICKLEELWQKLTEMRSEYVHHFMSITSVIDMLNDSTEKDVIRLWYIDGLNADAISQKSGYSIGTIYNIHSSAVKNISKILKNV